MRTRMLFWTGSFWPSVGGEETWSLRYLKALQERGDPLEIVIADRSIDQPSVARTEGLVVRRLPMHQALGDAERLRQTRNLAAAVMREFRPDCVHVSGFLGHSLLLYSLSKNAFPAPTILSVHSEWPDVHVGPGSLIERTAQAADRLCVFDPSMAKWVQDKWPALGERLQLIPHAMPPMGPIIPPPISPVRIAFCGRLAAEKGADVAIDAFAELLRDVPDARLTIAGDGPERAAIEARIQAHHLTNAVDLVGWLAPEGVMSLLDNCSFVVMPSRSEGFGLVALEAAWRARAVVCSRVGGLPSVVIHGETGLLCPPAEMRAFATAMRDLATFPDKARDMGLAARAAAERRFSWDAHVAAQDRLVQDVVTRTAP